MSIWTREVLTLALTVFLVRLGQGMQGGVSTNFLVHDLALGGDQVLWLAGFREIPGLCLILLAALTMRLPQSRRAFLSLLLMGLGYGGFSLVHSYGTLIALALTASVGFHNWMPLQSSLGMGLAGRGRSGRVLGRLAAVGSLASMGGMLVVVLLSEALGHRPFYVFGGALAIVAAFVVYRLPRDIGSDLERVPRIVLRRRYWLFYVLTFFEGSRTQVFHTFGAWVLVNAYGLSARQISLLLITSGILSFLISPRVGNWIDRYGERWLLASSYFGLVLAFIGYASVQSPWALGALYIAINLLVMFRIGLHTYVNRIAREGDLSPTLSAGVSINHVTSVGMSLVAGTLLRSLGYEVLCWGAAGIILLSIPFALAIRVDPVVESADSQA
ncbi:MAG: hypothetical protein QGI83_08750 [Candidatus Latescibacteria bacterium]|nr:hypothetical protein [Candidatus Latescibacterota bacterium]